MRNRTTSVDICPFLLGRSRPNATLYFNVRDEHGLTPDPEGEEFFNLEEAKLEAQASARDLAMAEAADRGTSRHRMACKLIAGPIPPRGERARLQISAEDSPGQPFPPARPGRSADQGAKGNNGDG